MRAGIYKHYKGGLYQVIGIAQHTETKEIGVVYISLTRAELPGPRIRFRSLDGPEGFITPVSITNDSFSDSVIILNRFEFVRDQ